MRIQSAKEDTFDNRGAMTDNLTTMPTLDEFIDDVKQRTHEALDRLVPAAIVEPTRLHEAIRWSLFAGGKRIRPVIVFATGQTFGASFEQLETTAAAIEMIHTYSLIHDDLPSMDDDDLRRGKATCHKQFGEATAILAGDVLQTLAFKSIAEDANLPAEIRAGLISTIATGAGTPSGMVSGQQLDLEGEGESLDINNVEQIHLQKTGALISAAAASGAIIGGASENELSSIGSYGQKLGLLFQITDDLLDVTQATETLGKTAGKDASAQKATYPSRIGIDATRSLAGQMCQEAVAILSTLNRNTDVLRSLTCMIADRTR
jgi:geranylgeranyl pyrophosphate synthase